MMVGVDKCCGWNAGGRPGQALECRLSSAWIFFCSMMQLSFIRGQAEGEIDRTGGVSEMFTFSSILTPATVSARYCTSLL